MTKQPSEAMTTIQQCPPHQWGHAPTVGYFRCGKCGEQINYDDPRYVEMLGMQAAPQPPAKTGDDEQLAQKLADALIADESSDLRPDYLREAILVSLSKSGLRLVHGQPHAVSTGDDELVARLRAQISVLTDAIVRAAKTFEHYAKLHADKGTPEGQAKSVANASEANHLMTALVLAGVNIEALSRKGRGE